jgi:transposase
MKTSNTVRLDPNVSMNAELKLIGDRVSCLWNAANYICRQHFLAKQGVPTGANLEKEMKDSDDYRRLPSDIAQETLKKLSEAWKSYFQLRKRWSANPSVFQKPGLPAYRKNKKNGQRPFDLIPIKHPRAYAINSKDVSIVLPRDRRQKASSANGRLNMPYRGRLRHLGKMGRAELAWDKTRKRWYFSITVTKDAVQPVPEGKSAALDLGVRILASLSIEGKAQALHFEGREVMKDWDYLGFQIAKEQEAISGTRGKPGQKAPSSRNISRLHQKRRLRVEHAIKVIAKEVAEVCLANGVSTVYLGWPKNILRDVKYGNSRWAERIHGFWAFDKALRLFENALAMVGIQTVRSGERGSSSTCPCCGSTEVIRHPRWLLRCKTCGETIHSDQAGSRNILSFNKPSVSWAGLEASPRTETRRWSRHQWDVRFANPRQAISLKFLQVA